MEHRVEVAKAAAYIRTVPVVQEIVDAGDGQLQFGETLVQVLQRLIGNRGQAANHVAEVINSERLGRLEFAARRGELAVPGSGPDFHVVIGEGPQGGNLCDAVGFYGNVGAHTEVDLNAGRVFGIHMHSVAPAGFHAAIANHSA